MPRIRKMEWFYGHAKGELVTWYMMMMFSLSTPAYPMGMLCGYKTNHLSPLPAEVSRVSIIVQINAGSLEGATSGSYAPVVSNRVTGYSVHTH